MIQGNTLDGRENRILIWLFRICTTELIDWYLVLFVLFYIPVCCVVSWFGSWCSLFLWWSCHCVVDSSFLNCWWDKHDVVVDLIRTICLFKTVRDQCTNKHFCKGGRVPGQQSKKESIHDVLQSRLNSIPRSKSLTTSSPTGHEDMTHHPLAGSSRLPWGIWDIPAFRLDSLLWGERWR